MADKPGRTLAKGYPEMCRARVSLPMTRDSIGVLPMSYTTAPQIPALLPGKKRFFLPPTAALPPVKTEYLPTPTLANFYKNQTERMNGRPSTPIFQRKRSAPFMKLPEAPFLSVATMAFLNPPTVEKPGNKSITAAGQ